MSRIVNWDLLSNPANWVIVFLVVYLSALIAHLVYSASASAPIQLPTGL